MGVDYYNCNICNEIYADCGDYKYCEKCETSFCENCVNKYNLNYNEEYEKDEEVGIINCPICNKIDVTNTQIEEFIKKKINMSRDEMKVEILKQ